MLPASSSNIALLIIDMQVGLFHAAEPPFDANEVLGNINHLIAKARLANVPVFAVRHTGPDGSLIAAGSSNWQLIPELDIDPSVDSIFDKTRPSCFEKTSLFEQLKLADIDTLVIAGMKTQYCVDTNCRIAASLGFRVMLAADGHTCMDTPDLTAAQIIAHHNLTLNGPFATVINTDAIRF